MPESANAPAGEATSKAATDAVPAASVILVRDSAAGASAGVEVLMLRRTAKASFAADAWVFPGGRIDPGDGADPLSMEAAREGAARETMEEAGIVVAPQALIPYAQWCPPPESPRRFLTWLFVAAAPANGEVTVDGGEITEHEWVRPADAIVARDEGRITLLPPTWVTLWDLTRRNDVDAVLSQAESDIPAYFETHIGFLPREDDPAVTDVVALWEGDAGYEARDAAVPGARHRLRMGAAQWRYERDG